MDADASRIFVVSGPGGVGKGTVVARLVESHPDLWLSRSWTTRLRRPGEAEDAYVFVDRSRFLSHLAGGGFLEHNEYDGNGHLYGTPLPDPPPGTTVLFEIDVNGARQIRARYPDAVVILVVPPSRAVQEERLRARGDDDVHVHRRLAVAETEEEEGRALADHVVVNDDLDRAVEEVAGILAGYRSAQDPTPKD